MTNAGRKEIVKLVSGQGGKPFTYIAIGCGSGKDSIDVMITKQKAEIQIYDNVIEYSSTFTFDNDTTVSESAVINENGVTLDIDTFTPLPIRKGSSITINHTITFDNEYKKIAIG